MHSEGRSRLILGLALMGVGALLLAYRLVPDLRAIVEQTFTWPLIIAAFGTLLLLVGISTGNPDLAAPAVFFMGLGAILYWQNTTQNWASWAYIWALFPGLVGVGQILSKLMGSQESYRIRDGLRAIGLSAVLFLVFSAFLGGPNLLGPYWPVLIILAGLWILARPFIWKE